MSDVKTAMRNTIKLFMAATPDGLLWVGGSIPVQAHDGCEREDARHLTARLRVSSSASSSLASEEGRQQQMHDGVVYRLGPVVTDAELNALFTVSWDGHVPRPFGPVLERSLTYVCAYNGAELVGFVNLAWDGGLHAFVLDTTVYPTLRRAGIGRRLVQQAVDAARRAGVAWVHVDYEPKLRHFYAACGFSPTEAGLIEIASTHNGC
ncbi:MAG: mshD9 [Chloroflexi bacterium]|nr:mshD9 [Chloroflexota bacterium]